MQRIRSGSMTGLVTGPPFRITYRRPGLVHILLTAVGAAPRGTIQVGTSTVTVTESSRRRRLSITMPTRAVRSIGFELARRLAPLFVGLVSLLIGGTALAFGIAHLNHEIWWPNLAEVASAEEILIVGIVLLTLGLVSLVVFVLRRDLELRFDVGGTGGARIHLRRSWWFPMPFHHTLAALATIPDIVILGQASPSHEEQNEEVPVGTPT